MSTSVRGAMVAGLSAWLAIALAAASVRAAPIIEAEAISGEPFGVGRLVVQLPETMLPDPLGLDGLGLGERSSRAFYPAVHNPVVAAVLKELIAEDSPLSAGGPVRQEVGGILRGVLSRPPRTTVHFLFRGTEPLELTLHARQSLPLVVQPRANLALHRRLLEAWWRDYSAGQRIGGKKPDYPPLVETYLVSNLARRLNLRLPRQQQIESAYAQFERELSVLAGTETVRTALLQDRVLGLTYFDLPADRAVPQAAEPPAWDNPEPPAKVEVEPMAMRVPAECLYVRFGNFDNFLWFQDTLDRWGGDLQNLVAMRGLDDQRNNRLQEQLVLRQTDLSRLLGGTVIADVALIGTDLLFRDGAAYGFVFQARNNALLAGDFSGQRADRLRRGGATEEKPKIAGREVSFLTSPDGSVRSYYAAAGDYHFVTSSKALMERFLQTADGRGSLGASRVPARRAVMPLARGDTVFVYLSDAFFRNITGPRYRIEMFRRMEAATDIDVVHLAKLNAAAEGKPAGTIEDMVAHGMLPPGFGPRPDGSRAVLAGGEVYDQLRGRRGAFVPVPDVPPERITSAEEASYQRFVQLGLEKWGRIEPIMLAVRRKAMPGRREQIVLDVRMTPLARQRVEFFEKWAGPADTVRLAAVPGDLAAFEAILRWQRLLGGLRDVAPPADLASGRLMPWLKLRDSVVGYLGTLDGPGILAVLDATFTTPPDAAGYARNVLGLWRLQSDRFRLYSFQQEVLAAVAPQLHFEQAPRPAQLRLHVGDISNARITPWLNDWGYARSRETALGNLRLLHMLNQQLHLPPKDCREAAEFLLAAKMVCPLGGQYVLREAPGAASRWTSTRLEAVVGQGRPAAPKGYTAPPLGWFRGLDLDASLVQRILSAHAELIMQLPRGGK